MSGLFQVPACISNISTRADKTLKLTIETQELSSIENAKLFSLHQKIGFFLFKENNFQLSDIPKESAKMNNKGIKTKGQRLRAVLFIYWKQKKIGRDFERFYEQWIEEKISKIKEQLT